MSRTITYRVKTPAGPWQRAVIDDTALPQTISGLVGDETYEVDTGKGTLVDVTTTVSFTLEVFTGTPVAEGSGVFLLEIPSPAHLASYDAGEVEGAGAYRYDTDNLTTGPIVLYPGTLNAGSYNDGDSITPGNAPFGVGSQVPTITYRVVSDTPSPNTEVFNGATLNFDTTGRGGEELSVRAVLTDDNGSTEATIATFTVGAFVFDPAALFGASEKGGWYDVSDTSTLWQDTAGTSAVTADGQSVARIDDKSGNGFHLTQSTAGSRPVYRTSAGLHWLELDGTDDQILRTAITAFSARTAFVGCEVTSSGQDDIIFIVSDVTVNNRLQIWKDAANTIEGIAVAGGSSTALSTALSGTAAQIAAIRTDTSSELYIDGVSEATGTARVPSVTDIRIGNASFGAGPNFTAGKIFGALVIDRALTTQEMSDMTAYLAAKSGVTL